MPDRNKVSSCFLLLTLFMFLLALRPVAELDGAAHQSTPVVSEPESQRMRLTGTPHGSITIDGDADFSDTALLEGWPGDGSPENPFIIDGLEIDRGGGFGNCIRISNTRVRFTISNCSLTRASVYQGTGIYLENVTNGEIVNNTCISNGYYGILLWYSDSNIVTDNTCISNGNYGIALWYSNSNTVTNNTCNSNDIAGIYLCVSDSNAVISNNCSSNTEYGIYIWHSNFNTVINNTCIGNIQYGIYLVDSDIITALNGEFDPVVLLLIGLVGITMLGAGWWKVSSRGSQDDIIVPTRYRLTSWFRKRKALKHVDGDETSEPESSDQ